MKKKIINVSLVLLLVLIVCLSVSVSASAESGNKPVAWVNFTGAGCGTRYGNPGHFVWNPYIPLITEFALPQANILVKHIANGDTVGHCRLRFLKLDEPIEEYGMYPDLVFNIEDSSFMELGTSKIADILTTTPTYDSTEVLYVWWHIVDNGEPGGGVDQFLVMYMSIDISDGNPFDSPFNPYDHMAEWNYWMGSLEQGVGIAPDNIQVHITDAYYE